MTLRPGPFGWTTKWQAILAPARLGEVPELRERGVPPLDLCRPELPDRPEGDLLARVFAEPQPAGPAQRVRAGLLSPARAVTLEVPGRRTARLISFPLAVADYDGERYLVAMLGNDTNWVLNVRAAEGRAVLRRGRREDVLLEEVDPGIRAPILRRYLAVAPGAR
ncbi:MAG: hypothetical protein JJE50_03730, partial [Actinomycetales bacterium]|nr:hypothetical protein [Actinomycetales bacterium]